MYRIVIPVDTEEQRGLQAVTFVTELLEDTDLGATADDIGVTVLNVFEKFRAVDEGSNLSSDELYDPESYPDSVITVAEALQEAGLEPEMVRRHGEPAEEIVEYADEVDADQIVITGRKRSPVGKAVFGSVIQQVVLETDRPVTIV